MNALDAVKEIPIRHNVSIKVIDSFTGKVVQEHTGHNNATNSMITGVGHYLIGDGVLNQGSAMLSMYVPKYISLGTMGLSSQEEDANGLPAGVGTEGTTEAQKFSNYMKQHPGFGADGYDENDNNDRTAFGLGPAFDDTDRSDYGKTIGCELISASFPRAQISYREVVPAAESELPRNIDIIYSAMISTGALKQFREPGKDYIFITEAGLWADREFEGDSNGGLGMLAGYRIIPPNIVNWNMNVEDNRRVLKENILKVGLNQVVQVIWKIQIGSIDELSRADRTGDQDLTYFDDYYADPEPIPVDVVTYIDSFSNDAPIPYGDVTYELEFELDTYV